jgi:lysophospholipid acyltransferase (LPLAT)-like uncharacterized protein
MIYFKKGIKNFIQRYFYLISGYLISLYIKFVYKTSQVTIMRDESVDILKKNQESVIYAFWHGDLMMMPILDAPHKKMMTLSSKNNIKYLTDMCVRQFGIATIYGSRSNVNKPHKDKGGTQALRQILAGLKNGYSISITPDGPLGPRHQVHEGIIVAAILSQKPIVAISYVSKYGIYAKSWDKFLIPLPFSKLYFKFSAPLYIPKDNSLENIAYYKNILQEMMVHQGKALQEIVL